MKEERRQAVRFFALVSLIVIPFFALTQAAAGFPATHPPKGYLVPTPSSIPVGMTQYGIPYFPYSTDSYTLVYTSSDHISRLIFSENPATPDDIDQTMRNYETSIHESVRRTKDCSGGNCALLKGIEKVRDIYYMGAHGVLFHTIENMNSTTISGYDLLMDDTGKLLRIQAHDGTNFHFTDDMVMAVLHGMVRQE